MSERRTVLERAPGPGEGDLDTRSKIHDLVVGFYREIVFDELLAPVFVETAEVDWSEHIPRLIDYWCQILLADPAYSGRVLETHRRVNELEPLGVELFDRWYSLWSARIDASWSGPAAERAKAHAGHVAGVLARRLAGTNWRPAHVTVDAN